MQRYQLLTPPIRNGREFFLLKVTIFFHKAADMNKLVHYTEFDIGFISAG